MVRLSLFSASDALDDAKRSKTKCKQLDDQLDKFKKLLEDKTVEPDYRHCLLFLLSNTKKFKPRKRGRPKVNIADEEEDCDDESDPEYDLFFRSLKKHENSYVLEGEINDVPIFIKYEGESSLKKECEHEGGRKVRTGVERIDGQSNQNPGLPNDQAPVKQHVTDMQAQSGNKSSTQIPGKLVNPVKREHVNEGENELSNQKPDLRTNGLSQNQQGDDEQALSNRMNNVESCKKLKNTTLVQADNGVRENQSEPHNRAQMGKKDKVQRQKKLRKSVELENMVKGDHMTSSESALKIGNDGHLHQRPGPTNNLVRKNQSKRVDQALPRVKDNRTIQRQVRKVANAKNVVKREHEAGKKAAITIENEHLYQIPGARKKLVTRFQYEHVHQTIPGDKDKVQSQRSLPKVVKEKNVVMEDNEASRESVVQHQKSGPKNNRVTEYKCGDIDQAQPGNKNMVQSQRKLRKVLKGKNEVKVENEANKNDAIHEHLYYKPGPRNNWVTENHCERVAQAQPIWKDKVQSQRKLKKVIKEENWFEEEIGSSNPKTAFGDNWAAKNQLEGNTQVQSAGKGICSKLNQEKGVNYESDRDVEVLDKATFFRTGNLDPLMTSKRNHESVRKKDDVQRLGSPRMRSEFRRRVLNALEKPFDEQEYKMHREAIKAGAYFKYHPDLERKLKKHRYRQGKCLAILRGFFFWLQNLMQEGAFKPWKDGQCLAVDPKAN